MIAEIKQNSRLLRGIISPRAAERLTKQFGKSSCDKLIKSIAPGSGKWWTQILEQEPSAFTKISTQDGLINDTEESETIFGGIYNPLSKITCPSDGHITALFSSSPAFLSKTWIGRFIPSFFGFDTVKICNDLYCIQEASVDRDLGDIRVKKLILQYLAKNRNIRSVILFGQHIIKGQEINTFASRDKGINHGIFTGATLQKLKSSIQQERHDPPSPILPKAITLEIPLTDIGGNEGRKIQIDISGNITIEFIKSRSDALMEKFLELAVKYDWIYTTTQKPTTRNIAGSLLGIAED